MCSRYYWSIRHFYGDQSDEILSRIDFVYISHIHDDHLAGLYGLIRERRRALQNLGRPYEKLILFCPNKYVAVDGKQWKFFSDQHFFYDDVQVIFNEKLSNDLFTSTIDIEEEEEFICEKFKSVSLHGIETVLVGHIYNAHALLSRHIDGWLVAFSGAWKQLNHFIPPGENVDVLIDESTFETDLEVYASPMRHCTMVQTIDVGRCINAKYTIP